jgi:hypothetical protein
MKHQSISQFLYSLYAVLLALMLVPVLIITLLQYIQVQPWDTENDLAWLFFAIPAVGDSFLFDYWYLKRLKSLRTVVSLSDKLRRFYSLTIVRYSGESFAQTLLVLGYLAVRAEWLSYLFVLILLYQAIQWPTLHRLCRALRLSAAECEALRAWK